MNTLDQINSNPIFAPIGFEKDFKQRIMNEIIETIKNLNVKKPITEKCNGIYSDFVESFIEMMLLEQKIVPMYRAGTRMSLYCYWNDKPVCGVKKLMRESYKKQILHLSTETIGRNELRMFMKEYFDNKCEELLWQFCGEKPKKKNTNKEVFDTLNYLINNNFAKEYDSKVDNGRDYWMTIEGTEEVYTKIMGLETNIKSVINLQNELVKLTQIVESDGGKDTVIDEKDIEIFYDIHGDDDIYKMIKKCLGKHYTPN